MHYEKLKFDLSDGIATLTLNRPEAFNALDMQLARELHHAVVTCSGMRRSIRARRRYLLRSDPPDHPSPPKSGGGHRIRSSASP